MSGLLGSAISFVLFVPQALRSWRQRKEPEHLLGVSVAMYVLLLVNAITWGVHGVLAGSFWAAVPGLFNGPLAVAMIVLAGRARRDAAHARPAGQTTEGAAAAAPSS